MCLSLIVALALGQNAPNDALAAAWDDLRANVPSQRWRTTRYLALYPWTKEVLESRLKALAFTQNSTSFRANLVPITLTPDGQLVRVDLEALGWDRGSRSKRLARLQQAGVKFAFKDARAQELFLDVWEQARGDDTYFRVSQILNGKYVPGWLNPVLEEKVRNATYSGSAVLRADQFLAKALTERADGGIYSELLMLPPKEADLYKAMVGPGGAEHIDREPQLKQGGGILESDAVAAHNRELQLIPSLFGHDERFIWRTFDFAADDKDPNGGKSVLERFAGTVAHDGREIIGTLPNGLHWYYLADAKGNQVNVVPQAIALDRRLDSSHRIVDRNVVNAYKCVSCHGTVEGIWPFEDVVRKGILSGDVGLLAIAKDREAVADLKERVEDYYLASLPARVARQQKSYVERVKATNGLEADRNADAVVTAWDAYSSDLVTLEQAAREMGMPVDRARAQLSLSGGTEGGRPLVYLSGGRPIRRSTWEKLFSDGMVAGTYPFQTGVKRVAEPAVKLRKAG